VRIFLATPPDSAGFWIIPDVATVHVQFKTLVKRHICIETHSRFAEVQARSIVNSNLIFVVICKYNWNSERGSSISSCLLDYLIHYPADIIGKFVIIVSDLDHLEIVFMILLAGETYDMFNKIFINSLIQKYSLLIYRVVNRLFVVVINFLSPLFIKKVIPDCNIKY